MPDDPLDDEDLQHVIDNQVLPQIFASEMAMRGVKIDVEMVNTRPDAEGFKISCVQCGRTARLPFELPKGKLALCPPCVRARMQ